MRSTSDLELKLDELAGLEERIHALQPAHPVREKVMMPLLMVGGVASFGALLLGPGLWGSIACLVSGVVLTRQWIRISARQERLAALDRQRRRVIDRA